MLSFLKNILSFLECQYSLDLRLFQMVHFQYFHNDTAEFPYPCYLSALCHSRITVTSNIFIMIQLSSPNPAISLLFATVESQSIHDYSSRWVLRGGLERERAERKTFRITVNRSSNKMLLRST